MVCSICRLAGHNKRTCPNRLQLTLILDEEPMEFDLELTPTPREEVDIATDGYTGILLDNDVFWLIGQQVLEIRDRNNRDWWESRIRYLNLTQLGEAIRLRNIMTDFTKTYLSTSDTSPNVVMIADGRRDGDTRDTVMDDLKKVSNILVSKNKALKPSALKFKYVKKVQSTPRWTWRDNKVKREAIEHSRKNAFWEH